MQPTNPQTTKVTSLASTPRRLPLYLMISTLLAAGACSDKAQQQPHILLASENFTESEAYVPEGIELPTISEIPDNGILQVTPELRTQVRQIGSRTYILAHGALTDRAFGQLTSTQAGASLLGKQEAMRLLVSEVEQKAHAIVLQSYAEIGYFEAWVPYESKFGSTIRNAGELSFEVRIEPENISPVAERPLSLSRNETTTLTNGSVATDLEAFGLGLSGQNLMGVQEFIAKVRTDSDGRISANGSSVRLGITDTGITYNHPMFRKATLTANSNNFASRINYMTESSAEGLFFLSKENALSIREASTSPSPSLAPSPVSNIANRTEGSQLIINGVSIRSARVPQAPQADVTEEIKDQSIKVSSEQSVALLDSTQSYLLGFYDEALVSGESEPVDLDLDGSSSSKIPVLVRWAEKAEETEFLIGTKSFDFRNATWMKPFRVEQQTAEIGNERVGISVKRMDLPLKNAESKRSVLAAAFVGFDPGNHGSHVAGIAAGGPILSQGADAAGKFGRGVAPEAQIQMARVCMNNAGCRALPGFVELATEAHSQVINMSLGGLGPFNDGFGVEETMINRLSQVKNILFVISAGNEGPGHQTLGSPSTARLSLSVGAATSRRMMLAQRQWPANGGSSDDSLDQPFLFFFSSRGPTAAGGFKPNVVAPGGQLSAVQLSHGEGHRAGLDAYWGTSMSAPATTGAFALLLDAAQKWNEQNPTQQLPVLAETLRQVIIESARPFDRAEPGVDGRAYTWADQGAGMVNLPAAWELLKGLATDAHGVSTGSEPEASLKIGTESIHLDYQLAVELKNPSGQEYDGTRFADRKEGHAPKSPIFGAGIYIDAHQDQSLYPVDILRSFSQATDVTAAHRVALATSADEFVLKTVYTSPNGSWLKAGVPDQVPCNDSETANLRIVGEGASLQVEKNKETNEYKGKINRSQASTLWVCVNRQITETLPAGDHGAMIYAYRIKNGKTSALASFVVPVFYHQEHKALGNGQGFEIQGQVGAFGVKRHYVRIPSGTKLVRVSLEVPKVSRDTRGRVLPETCASVELMGRAGLNVEEYFQSRKAATVENCDKGAESTRTRVIYITEKPTSGVWDVDVFGRYQFANSPYTLKVDFVNFEASVPKITGNIRENRSGTFQFRILDTSTRAAPSASKSTAQLNSLFQTQTLQLKHEEVLISANAAGEKFRSYDDKVSEVEVRTGGSTGNDIDLTVYECQRAGTTIEDSGCTTAASPSAGATDVELVKFKPKSGKFYAAVLNGFDMGHGEELQFSERLHLSLPSIEGTLQVQAQSNTQFTLEYVFTEEQLASSPILQLSAFQSGHYKVAGKVELKAEDGTENGTYINSLAIELGK